MKFTHLPLICKLLPFVFIISCKKNNSGGSTPLPIVTPKVVVTTIAGDGTGAFLEGPALSARFHSPTDVAVAPDGTIYVADFQNGRIRKISNGQVSTFAGSDTSGYKDGHGALARFDDPYQMAIDATGNLYVIEGMDPRVRKITPSADVSTYAGTELPGFKDGPSLMAQFALNIGGIATDAQGNVLIGDAFNNRIRKITQATQVGTIAGTGDPGKVNGGPGIATFNSPTGLVVDHHGNIFVADQAGSCIRKITPDGQVSRFAGADTAGIKDGFGTAAQFNFIADLVIDAQDYIYVSDGDRIRMVTPQAEVVTIAGGDPGFADGNGASAKFHGIGGLGIDAQGIVYAADIQNHRIRKISVSPH